METFVIATHLRLQRLFSIDSSFVWGLLILLIFRLQYADVAEESEVVMSDEVCGFCCRFC